MTGARGSRARVMPRPRAMDAVGDGPDASRATPGVVVGQERAQLAAGLGAYLYAQRLELGLSQEALAAAAGMSRRQVQRLERGEARPSDRSTASLAGALCRGRDELTVAVEDLRLQRLAGPSLRPWRRRRVNPRRVALYERAARVLDEQVAADGDRAAVLAETLDRVFGDARPRVR